VFVFQVVLLARLLETNLGRLFGLIAIEIELFSNYSTNDSFSSTNEHISSTNRNTDIASGRKSLRTNGLQPLTCAHAYRRDLMHRGGEEDRGGYSISAPMRTATNERPTVGPTDRRTNSS
jgi:hypothetical protein